jgi:hypothetical protein
VIDKVLFLSKMHDALWCVFVGLAGMYALIVFWLVFLTCCQGESERSEETSQPTEVTRKIDKCEETKKEVEMEFLPNDLSTCL